MGRQLSNLLARRWLGAQPGDWQTLGLLIRANTGSGPQTKNTIDLASVVSFIAESFLHLLDRLPLRCEAELIRSLCFFSRDALPRIRCRFGGNSTLAVCSECLIPVRRPYPTILLH